MPHNTSPNLTRYVGASCLVARRLALRYAMQKLTFLFMLVLQPPTAHAGACDIDREMTSAQDWVIENICHFKNTVLAEIESDYLRKWYNPLTHFSPPNTFKYDVNVLEVFKGEAPNTSCMFQSTEATFVIRAGIAGTRRIVSFDEPGECVVIDVGAMQKATPELIRAAREAANSTKRGP